MVETLPIANLTTSTTVFVSYLYTAESGTISSIFAGSAEAIIPDVKATIDTYEQNIADGSVSFNYNGRLIKEAGRQAV